MKLNNKVLLALLGVLAAIFLYTQYSGNKEGTFKKDLFATDTAKITSITIYPNKTPGKQLTLNRQDDGWKMTNDSITDTAVEPASVKSMLTTIAQLSVKRLAAAGKDKWAEYEIDDNATRVVAKQGSKTVLDIYIGKFNVGQPQNAGSADENFNPNQMQRPTLTTYIRLHNDDKVYAVDGMVGAPFSKQPPTFQPKVFEDTQILTPDTIIRQPISTE